MWATLDFALFPYLAVGARSAQILVIFLLVCLDPGVTRGRALVRWKALDELEMRKPRNYPWRRLVARI